MKKLIIAACMLFSFAGIAAAQTTDAAKQKKEVKKHHTAPHKASLTKKDGTADMRFKVNKEKKAPVTGPVKKDGTPDKRYKANKTPKPKS